VKNIYSSYNPWIFDLCGTGISSSWASFVGLSLIIVYCGPLLYIVYSTTFIHFLFFNDSLLHCLIPFFQLFHHQLLLNYYSITVWLFWYRKCIPSVSVQWQENFISPLSTLKTINLQRPAPSKCAIVITPLHTLVDNKNIFFLSFLMLRRTFFVLIVQYLGVRAEIEPGT
jgi:hypothetical protein